MTYQGITRRGKTQEIVNKNCHCRGMLSGIFNAGCNQIRRKALLNGCVEDPRLRISGMTANWMSVSHLTYKDALNKVYRLGVSLTGAASKPEYIRCKAGKLSGLATIYKGSSGFTLIELLVVVLIIGILAAVAVPQYQVAVQKAKLMKYVPIVRALNEAEQVYFLDNGEYTADLRELDVEIPAQGCTYKYIPSGQGYYRCGTERYGVWGNVSNAQAGDDKIRYVQLFADYDQYNMKAGDVACYSKGEVARKACRSLGPGSEQPSKSSSWEYVYTLNR